LIVTFIFSSSPADQCRVQIRCRNIADAIQRTGYHSARLLELESFIQNTPEAQAACQQANLLVIHRHLYGAAMRTILMWKARGKKVLVDFDEAVDLITPDMPAYSFWQEGRVDREHHSPVLFEEEPVRPIPLDQFSYGLKALDGATVPSLRLADDWSSSVRTYFLPDYLNIDQYLVQRPGHNGHIHIGVSGKAGSFTNLERSGLISALEDISLQRDEVVVHFFEMEQHAIKKTRIPPAQCQVHNAIQAYHWPLYLANLDIGIACAEGKYAMRASKLPILEYSVMKIPWLASNLIPFREMDHYGWLVPNTGQQWTWAILEVIDHLGAYQAEANGEPFLYGISQDVYENVEKILAVYESILSE
jgi:hypothetical protein